MKIKIDALDKLFSRYIRNRDRCCQRCGSSKSLQCCHMHSRRHQNTRFDPDNAVALCFGCHQYLDSHPIEKIEFFQARLGGQGFDLLRARSQEACKIDREAIKLWLQKELNG